MQSSQTDIAVAFVIEVGLVVAEVVEHLEHVKGRTTLESFYRYMVHPVWEFANGMIEKEVPWWIVTVPQLQNKEMGILSQSQTQNKATEVQEVTVFPTTDKARISHARPGGDTPSESGQSVGSKRNEQGSNTPHSAAAFPGLASTSSSAIASDTRSRSAIQEVEPAQHSMHIKNQTSGMEAAQMSMITHSIQTVSTIAASSTMPTRSPSLSPEQLRLKNKVQHGFGSLIIYSSIAESVCALSCSLVWLFTRSNPSEQGPGAEPISRRTIGINVVVMVFFEMGVSNYCVGWFAKRKHEENPEVFVVDVLKAWQEQTWFCILSFAFLLVNSQLKWMFNIVENLCIYNHMGNRIMTQTSY